jgi:hypothetical protein
MSRKLVWRFGKRMEKNEAWVVDENYAGSIVKFEFLSSVCSASLLHCAKHVEDTQFPLAEIFFCQSACLSGQTRRGTVAQADSAARAELQEAPKQKLLQLTNIQKYHWVKHKEMLICSFDVFPIM